jgi:hypothetical protein
LLAVLLRQIMVKSSRLERNTRETDNHDETPPLRENRITRI